jgi:hypothetical protein
VGRGAAQVEPERRGRAGAGSTSARGLDLAAAERNSAVARVMNDIDVISEADVNYVTGVFIVPISR